MTATEHPNRLNLGCGPTLAPGWLNVDVRYWDTWPGSLNCRNGQVLLPEKVDGHTLDQVGLVVPGRVPGEAFSLPLRDASQDGAVAHHVLQMVPYPDLVPWLAEVRRVLRPGAWLRMTVPDLLGAVEAYGEVGGYARGPGHLGRDWFPISDDLEPTLDGKLCLYVSQAGATRSVFTGRWLVDLCGRAGYRLAHTVGARRAVEGVTYGDPWLCELDSRLGESIVVEASA